MAPSSVDNNPVFKTEGEEIDEDGYLIQFLLQGSNNSYIIGLENTSNFSITLSLSVEGLDILDNIYKGQAKPIFTIKVREKKVFNVKVVIIMEMLLSNLNMNKCIRCKII